MKWFKRILGILLIAAAVGGMYYWSSIVKKESADLEAQKLELQEEIPLDPNQRVFQAEMSYFPIRNSEIYARSKLMKAGDFVSIYHFNTGEKIGKYEVALVDEDQIEIICRVEDFFNLSQIDQNDLILVMEASDG